MKMHSPSEGEPVRTSGSNLVGGFERKMSGSNLRLPGSPVFVAPKKRKRRTERFAGFSVDRFAGSTAGLNLLGFPGSTGSAPSVVPDCRFEPVL